MAVPQTLLKSLIETSGGLYRGKVSEEQKGAADPGIVLRATLAFSNVSLHADQLDPRQGIVYECNVLITKLATIHEIG